MQCTLCQNCKCLLLWKRKLCPLCKTAQEPGAPRYAFCRKDGTLVLVSEPVCPTCRSSVKIRPSFPIWARGSLVLLLGVGLFALLFGMHSVVSASYQPATCQISAGQVVSSSDNNGTTYQAVFDATILNDQGQVVLSPTNDSLGLPSYDNADQAQQDLKQHSSGSSYPCEYSPLAWPKVRLSDAQSSEMPLIVRAVLATLAYLFASLSMYLLYVATYETFRLYRRGISTSGTVVRKDSRLSAGYTVTNTVFSIVEFQTCSEPAMKAQASINRSLPLHSSVSVCYDPLNPAGNSRVSATGNPLKLAPVISGILLSLVVLVGGGVLAFVSVVR